MEKLIALVFIVFFSLNATAQQSNSIIKNLKIESIFYGDKANVIKAVDSKLNKEYIIITSKDLKSDCQELIEIGKSYEFQLIGYLSNANPLKQYHIRGVYSGLLYPFKALNINGLCYRN